MYLHLYLTDAIFIYLDHSIIKEVSFYMVKKIIFLTPVSLLSFLMVSSQIRNISKEDYSIQNFKTRTIGIEPSKTSVTFHHIESISIIDLRPDTLAVGLEQKNYQKPHFLVFKNGLTQESGN